MPYQMSNGKWRAHKMIDGVRRTKTFGRKAEAVRWEADQDCEKWRQQQIPTVSLLEWATRYLDHAKQRCAEKTYQEKRVCFRRLLGALPSDFECDRLTVAQAAAHLGRQAQERSGHSANVDRKNLAAAWAWGAKYLGLPQQNPFRAVDQFPEERSPRHVPTVEEMERVLAKETSEVRLLLLTMLHTAARRGELLRLRWDDVDLEQKTIRLSTRKRKGGSLEYDVLPLTDKLRAALVEHKKTTKSMFVFSDPETGQPYKYRRHLMARVCKRAGVRHFGFHAIRHLSASMMARAGVDLVTIQAILRHKSATTTARYLRSLGGVHAELDRVFSAKVITMNKAPGAVISRG